MPEHDSIARNSCIGTIRRLHYLMVSEMSTSTSFQNFFLRRSRNLPPLITLGFAASVFKKLDLAITQSDYDDSQTHVDRRAKNSKARTIARSCQTGGKQWSCRTQKRLRTATRQCNNIEALCQSPQTSRRATCLELSRDKHTRRVFSKPSRTPGSFPKALSLQE